MRNLIEKRRISGHEGFTLIELIVVMAIAGILLALSSFEFFAWKERYDVESEGRKIYSDLMTAKASALTQRKLFFVNVPTTTIDNTTYKMNVFRVYADDYPPPEGDYTLQIDNDTLLINSGINYIINVTDDSKRHFGFNKQGIVFDSNGILGSPIVLKLESTDGDQLYTDYDCIEILSTRVGLGLYNSVSSKCEVR